MIPIPFSVFLRKLFKNMTRCACKYSSLQGPLQTYLYAQCFHMKNCQILGTFKCQVVYLES